MSLLKIYAGPIIVIINIITYFWITTCETSVSGLLHIWCKHDDVMKWKHVTRYWSCCARNSPVTVEFPSQRPVTRSFDVFFDLRLYEQLSKQSWGWWFETPACSLCRHCNEWISMKLNIFYRTKITTLYVFYLSKHTTKLSILVPVSN